MASGVLLCFCRAENMHGCGEIHVCGCLCFRFGEAEDGERKLQRSWHLPHSLLYELIIWLPMHWLITAGEENTHLSEHTFTIQKRSFWNWTTIPTSWPAQCSPVLVYIGNLTWLSPWILLQLPCNPLWTHTHPHAHNRTHGDTNTQQSFQGLLTSWSPSHRAAGLTFTPDLWITPESTTREVESGEIVVIGERLWSFSSLLVWAIRYHIQNFKRGYILHILQYN